MVEVDENFEGSIFEKLGFSKYLCTTCKSHLREGICLNGCHLPESFRERFHKMVEEVINKRVSYRPSNSTEGMMFEAAWCNNCKREEISNGCEIHGRALAFTEDHSDYPKEWVRDRDGPKCLTFEKKR